MLRRLVLAGCFALLGCGGEPSPLGLFEPIRVRNAELKRGPLPGEHLPSEAPTPTTGAQVTSIETNGAILFQRQRGRVLSGRTSTSAFSIGVGLAGIGYGYWVSPVGGPDPMVGNELTYSLTVDVGDDVPTGLQRLSLVAFDEAGVPGARRDVRVCVVPSVPDNLNACDATLRPPDTVISLAWEESVDLNLIVVTPDGKVVDPRHPTTAPREGNSVSAAALRDPATGTLDRDSNAACVLDDIRRENLVFPGTPPAGVYRIYASLFDACGALSVGFRATVHRGVSDEGGRWHVEETWRRNGGLTRVAADGGRTLGVFVGEVELP